MPPVTTASIQDQKRQYDYIKFQNDVVIVERDNGTKFDSTKVMLAKSARSWKL